jgi:hypothetical protein
MLNLFKKKTELDILRKEFSFLENDFGYSLITEETQKFYKGNNVLIYRNDNAEKQIEICGGGSFFHCIIRKIEDEQLCDYTDDKKNIGFEDLAIIDNPKYDHFDFFAGGSTGVDGVTKNTVALFKRQEKFLTKTEWIDLEKVEQFKNEEFKSRFGMDRLKHKGLFIDEIKEMVATVYPYFKLVFDNGTFPFYHEDSTLEKLKYEWNGKTIVIEQYDWRDYREIYTVFMNENKLKEIDTSRFKNKEGAIEEIKKACNKVYNA